MAARRPIRVLHCCYHLQGGGAERQLQLLVRELQSHEVESSIFCIEDRGRSRFGAAMPVFVGRRRHVIDMRFIGDLYRALREFQPDIVHVWLPEVLTIPAMLMARLRGCRVVYSYRWEMHFHRLLALVEFLCAAACAHRVISNHSPIRSQPPYQWLFRRRRGVVIPNAVEANPVSASTERSAHPRRLLFAGRLTGIKNWRCLVEAMALLPRSLGVELAICGDGEDRAEMEALIEQRNLRGVVQLLGFRDDLPALMLGSELLILPSWREGSPNVALEAMALGLPCLLSDIAAHRELLNGAAGGLLFDPRSAADLAACIERALTEPGVTQELRRIGLQIAADRSPAHLAARHALVYRQLVQPVGQPASLNERARQS